MDPPRFGLMYPSLIMDSVIFPKITIWQSGLYKQANPTHAEQLIFIDSCSVITALEKNPVIIQFTFVLRK